MILLATGLAVATFALFTVSCAGTSNAAAGDGDLPDASSPPREFRAAWVATVANIDWPSRPGLSVAEQKAEADAILDRLVELHMNAVVFQVRPHADALYDSPLEPWSAYLTGQQGRAPEPYYDPLEYWCDQAHARGLLLHAWFNPYRANHPGNPGELAEDALVNARPELVVKLGDKGYWWMDPALQAVQDHSVAVVLDVVERYDVDGVHFDDYFYPYDSYNDGEDFPDDASWKAYREGGGELGRHDWRRAAVDTFIERLAREISALRPEVAFGISPFGIWRPGHPPSVRGLDQYDALFADARRWIREGWVDYLTPQLYWPIAAEGQSFPALLGWWSRQNPHGRHLWPGMSVSRARDEEGAKEIVNQVMVNRGMVPEAPGFCVFSMKALQNPNRPVGRALREGPLKAHALVPPTPWLDASPPEPPSVRADLAADGSCAVAWEGRGEEPAFRWVVSAERGGVWQHRIFAGAAQSTVVPRAAKPIDRIAVVAVDRLGNASSKTIVEIVR